MSTLPVTGDVAGLPVGAAARGLGGVTTSERITLPWGGGPASPGGAGGLSIGDVLSILRRRFVSITLLWLCLGSLATGAFFFCYKYFPIWTAEGWIEVRSDKPRGMHLEGPQWTKDEADNLLRTQAIFVKLPTVLQSALRTPEVKGTQWYRWVTPDWYTELDEDLSSTPVRGTNFIKVSMGAYWQKDPRVIVDKVIDSYLAEVQARATTRYRVELDLYQKEKDILTNNINKKRQERTDFIKTLPPGVVSGNGSTIAPQMMLTIEQISQFELFTNQLEQLVKIYSSTDGPALSPDDRQLVEDSPTIAKLSDQESNLELQRTSALGRFGPNHAQVKEIQIALDAVHDKLNEERQRRMGDIQNWKRDQAETQFREYQFALLAARDKLADYEAQQADLDRKIAEYENINEELVLMRIAEQRMSDYIRELDRAAHEQQAIDVRKAQPPIDPLERTWPRWYVLPVGLVLALLLSVGLSLVLELLDTSVRTPQDIVRHLSAPLLGTVPDADDDEIRIERVETAVRDAPHSMIVEAFRQIRANLQFSAPADRQRSLVITSPRPEDGKTTVACNLAASLAQAGRRILLVDANFRRPAIHRIYTSANGKGLSNILIGEAILDECRSKTDMPNLDVLTTGPLPPNPAELINSEMFRRLLQDATSKYDQVIFDAPPVLLASDALVIGTLVDGAVLVCRARENSRGIAQRAIALLQRVNAHVFGAVLNAAQVRRGGYFREQLRTFYEYQQGELQGNGHPALPLAGKS